MLVCFLYSFRSWLFSHTILQKKTATFKIYRYFIDCINKYKLENKISQVEVEKNFYFNIKTHQVHTRHIFCCCLQTYRYMITVCGYRFMSIVMTSKNDHYSIMTLSHLTIYCILLFHDFFVFVLLELRYKFIIKSFADDVSK